MANSEPVKDIYGLGTNIFEVTGGHYDSRDEETYEEYVVRYFEPLRRNQLRQALRDAIDLCTFGKRCLGQLNELLPSRETEGNPYPTQFEILQPKPAKSETSLVRGNEANAEREWEEEEAMINRRLEDIKAHGSSISSAIERIATSLAPHEIDDEKSEPQFLWKVLCDGDPQWDAKWGIRSCSWRDHIHRTTLPPPYTPFSERHEIDGAPTPYITLHEYPAYAVEEIYSIQRLVARGFPGVVALISTALMQKLGVNFRKRSAIENKKPDNTVEDVGETSFEDPYAWWAELWIPIQAIGHFVDFKQFIKECRLKGILDKGNNVKPQAYREVIQYQHLSNRDKKFSRVSVPPARSELSLEADQGADPGAIWQRSSMRATSQQVEARQVAPMSQPLEHSDVAKDGSSNAAQMSLRSSTPALSFSPKQEVSTTREPADVGTLTSTTTLAQAPIIHLPATEASVGASQPHTTATASTSSRPPLQLPPQPGFSSSREPANVGVLTQSTGGDPVIQLNITPTHTRVARLNANAAPFALGTHLFPGSAAASTPSQNTSAPTGTGSVTSNVTLLALNFVGSSTSIAQPASTVLNTSSNTPAPDPITSNIPSSNANPVPATSEAEQEQLIDVRDEISDDPPVVQPGMTSNVPPGNTNLGSDTTQG